MCNKIIWLYFAYQCEIALLPKLLIYDSRKGQSLWELKLYIYIYSFSSQRLCPFLESYIRSFGSSAISHWYAKYNQIILLHMGTIKHLALSYNYYIWWHSWIFLKRSYISNALCSTKWGWWICVLCSYEKYIPKCNNITRDTSPRECTHSAWDLVASCSNNFKIFHFFGAVTVLMFQFHSEELLVYIARNNQGFG